VALTLGSFLGQPPGILNEPTLLGAGSRRVGILNAKSMYLAVVASWLPWNRIQHTYPKALNSNYELA